MAKVIFTGLCGGTVEKVSKKTQKPYKVTSFTDLSGDKMVTFDVFGDLGLSRDMAPREYVFDCQVVSLGQVSVVPGSAGKIQNGKEVK